MSETTLITPDCLGSIAKLEQLCFADPWSEAALGVLCREHGCGIVIPASDREAPAIAYAGMTYAADEASVTNVAVHPDHRRRGLGKVVMHALMKQARDIGARTLYLEVRASNEAAISLYHALGFDEIGRRPGFYRHPTEDALLMCATLGVSLENEKDT